MDAATAERERRLIALADTMHDCWDGYRNIDDGGESRDEIREFMYEYLTATNATVQCHVTPNSDATFLTYLKSCLAGDAASSITPSDIEDQTIHHFEKIGRAPSVYTTLTYSAIAGGAVLPDTDVLHIVPDDAGDEKDLDAAQKRIVADFILRYIFHIPAAEAIGFNSYFTFDMGMSGVGTIFTDHPNAIRLITPQNIADSADTSTKKMGAQDNVFDFIETPGATEYVSEGNVFSSPTYRVGLRNTAFNSADPFAFSYFIRGPTGEHVSPFSSDETEGPPLDYLMKCHLDAAAPPPTPAEFRDNALPTTSLRLVDDMPDAMVADIIGRTMQRLEALFLDIKRCGDWDQVYAAILANEALKSVVMVTGDRLCSLASRLKGQRCIYQSKHVLKIYRFMPYNLDPAGIEAYLAGQRAAEDARFLAAYNAFGLAIKNPGLIPALMAFNATIQTQSDTMPPAFPMRSIAQIKLRDMYNDVCKMINAARIIQTVVNGVTTVIQQVITGGVPAAAIAADPVGFGASQPFAAAAAGIPNYTEAMGMSPFTTTIRDTAIALAATPANAAAEVAYIRAVFNLLASANIMKEFAMDIVSASAVAGAAFTFNRSKEYPFLNYSYKQLKSLSSAYVSVHNSLIDNRRLKRGPPSNWFDIINMSDGYNTILQQVKYTISDPAQLDAYSIDCDLPPVPGEAEEARNARTAVIVRDEMLRVDALGAVAPVAIVPGCQTGGSLVMRQNRIELFHDICARAATYVDSVFTTEYPLIVLQSMIRQIDAAKKNYNATPNGAFPMLTLIENADRFIVEYNLGAIVAPGAINTELQKPGGDLTALIAHIEAAAAAYPPDAVMSGLLGALNIPATFQLIEELSIAWDQGAAETGIDKHTGNISSILNGSYFASAAERQTYTKIAAIMGDRTIPNEHKLQAFIAHGIPQEVIAAATAAPALPGMTPQDSVIQHILSIVGNNYATSLVAPTLVMLAIMNDIIEGNVTSSTSLYTSVFLASGTVPAAVRKQSWDDQNSWDNLTNFFGGNITIVSTGKISRGSLALLAGGARRRKRRTIRKNGRSMRRRRATARR
jgi:hypothetical protein